MKGLIFLLILCVAVCGLWITSGFWKFSREDYIPQKVLEISRPINGKIDIEFLKRFDPAYEQ